MIYKALVDFRDLASGIDYKAGDTVDLSGAPASKIDFMLKPNKSRGALIEEAEEDASEDSGEDAEEDDAKEYAEIDEPQGV